MAVEQPSPFENGVAELRIHLTVTQQIDVEIARRGARALAVEGGFNVNQTDDIVVAVSELATNLMRHAVDGSMTLSLMSCAGRSGMRIESIDAGPGIDDLERALQDGYSTGNSLGSGLSIARRLMDDSTIESSSAGTSIVAHKWKHIP